MTSNKNTALVIAALLSLSGSLIRAEDFSRGPFGFLRMLDAVNRGSGRLEFIIDGRPVRPDGYQLGNVTGAIALKPMTHSVAFRRDGVKTAQIQLLVTGNNTMILIPFAEQIPANDDQPAQWAIKILKLKQHEPANKRTATFVSVAPVPELTVEIRQPDGQWQSVPVKRLGIARADIQQARGYLPVRCLGRTLSPISIGPSGNFVAVFYQDELGTLRSKNFQDYQYLSPD
jgi:hypothetical protein